MSDHDIRLTSHIDPPADKAITCKVCHRIVYEKDCDKNGCCCFCGTVLVRIEPKK